MKNLENLGRSLRTEEKKQISGGALAVYTKWECTEFCPSCSPTTFTLTICRLTSEGNPNGQHHNNMCELSNCVSKGACSIETAYCQFN